MSTTEGRTRPNRTIEEAVGYAVAHRTRVEVLTALNERSCTATDLARLLHQPLSTITHHVDELLNAGSIEVAGTRRARAIDQKIYRAVAQSYFSDEEVAALDFESRQAIYGLVIQGATAEVLSSLRAGRISDDPQARMMWRWFNVDEQGRRDIADALEGVWERVTEIEAESTGRRADSSEPAQSIIVTTMGYERSRFPESGTD